MSEEELADVSSTSAPPESHPRASQDEVDTPPPFISEISEGISPEVVRESAHLSGPPPGTTEEQLASSDATGGTAHRREEVTKSKSPTPTEPSPNSRTESVHNSTDTEDLGGSANHGVPEEQDGNLTAEENNGISKDPSTFGGLDTGDVSHALNANEAEQSTSSIAAGGAARRIEPPPKRTESVHNSPDAEDLGGSSNHGASKEKDANLPADANNGIAEVPLIPGGLDPRDVPNAVRANEAERSRLLADIFLKWEDKALARAQVTEKAVLGDAIDIKPNVPKYTHADLRETNKGFCKAVVEFELNASRDSGTASRALHLCETLLERSVPDVFDALRDFRPHRRPKLPNKVKERMEETMKGNWKHDQGEALNIALFWYSVSPRERLKARAQTWEAERAEALRELWEQAREKKEKEEEEEVVQVFGVSIAKLARLALTLRALIECECEDSGGKPEMKIRTVAEAKEILDRVQSETNGELTDVFRAAGIASGKLDPDVQPRQLAFCLTRLVNSASTWTTTKSASDEAGKQAKVWDMAKEKVFKRRRNRMEYDDDVWSEEWDRFQAEALQFGSAHERITSGIDRVLEQSLEINDEFYRGQLDEDLWDGGSLRRARDEHQWMVNDYVEHRDQWGEEEWRGVQGWWIGVLGWKKRAESRSDVIDAFKTTCLASMESLGRIDGSAWAHKSNFCNASHATYEDDRRHLLVDYIYHAKVAMHLGNERQFVRCCNSVLDLLRQTMRSENVKQGLDSETRVKVQDHFRKSFLDFAAVAVFFSSITATTLQFSFQSANSTNSSTIVNLCWFTSLVFSMASATHLWFGVVIYRHYDYFLYSRSPTSLFLQNWFMYIPPQLVTQSGVLFLVGLCGFTFLPTKSLPGQGRSIQTITSMLICTNVLALVFIVLLIYTRLIHRVAVPVQTVYSVIVLPLSHLAIVSALLCLTFLALPFMPLVCFICYRNLPPNFEKVLRPAKEFIDKLLSVFVRAFDHNLEELKMFENKYLGWPVSFICFTTHSVIVLEMLFLALVALPFMTPYCLIRYKKFPPDYKEVLASWRKEDFGEPGGALYLLYWDHRNETEKYILGFWTKLKEFPFVTKISGHWKKKENELGEEPSATTVTDAADV